MARNLKTVGSNPFKVEGVQKVTGAAKYAGDIFLPGMLHGKIKRSPHAHAMVAGIDCSKALALDGVKAVITCEDVPDQKHAGAPPPRAGGLVADQHILTRHARFVGDGVAAVAAVSEEIAKEALELIKVSYEVLPAVFDSHEAMRPGAPSLHGTEKNLAMQPALVVRGDVEVGFKEADLILEREYSTGRFAPAYMEPNICVCSFDLSGKLTVWSSTQCAFMVRGTLAEQLGIPINKVRVIAEFMGGSFGAKQDCYQHEYVCALLAQKTGLPVRMEYSRAESFWASKTRHPVKIRFKQGVKKDGTITARQASYLANTGAYASHAVGVTWVGLEDMSALYRCSDNLKLEGNAVYTNNPVAGAFRGFGGVQSFFAFDSHMDELAAELGMDPVDFRLKNAVREGDHSPVHGVLVEGQGLKACLERGAQEVDWYDRRSQPQPEEPHLKMGWGVGTEMHGSGAWPSINEISSAIIKINDDGTVNLLTGVADLGTGAQTAMAQIAAEELGIPLDLVTVAACDTEVVPFDIGAYASRTTFVGGGAVLKAARDAKAQLLELAAARLETEASALSMDQGRIWPSDAPQNTVSLKDLVRGKGGVSPRVLVAKAVVEPEVAFSYGAHFAQVVVDTKTGQIQVKRVVAVHEVGKAIYPKGVEGQIEGGIQQGIGHTLTEELVVDQTTGKTLNASFVDYKMPLALDMPQIKTVILEEAPHAQGPYGAKGIGEDPIMTIGPAIANAVYDAIGVRFRYLPITPQMVLEALRDAGRA